jgi:hypothetical protein
MKVLDERSGSILNSKDQKFNDQKARSELRNSKELERKERHEEQTKNMEKDQAESMSRLEDFCLLNSFDKENQNTENTKDENFCLPDPKRRRKNPVLEFPRNILSNPLVVESMIRNKIRWIPGSDG